MRFFDKVIINAKFDISYDGRADVKPWQQRSAGALQSSYALRDDVVEPSLGTEKALAQAPAHDAGHFLVPRVIGG